MPCLVGTIFLGAASGQTAVVRRWMCDNFYDIRTFGAVMNTRVNCAQVRGRVQLTFARSLDPVVPMDVAITRLAVTVKEPNAQSAERGSQGTDFDHAEMGRKAILPYGLYRGFSFVSPMLASDTGFDDNDLQLLWQAMLEMWECDRSAGRGLMACRELYVFTHASKMGNAPAEELFALLEVKRKSQITAPRSFLDYDVRSRIEDLPSGVVVTSLRSSEIGSRIPKIGDYRRRAG